MDNKRKYMLWLPLTAAFFLVAGIWVGRYLSFNESNEAARRKLDQVFNIISQNYVDEVDLDSLVEMVIPQLLENLDPHSAYIPASSRERVNRELEGAFYGIGIQFQMLNDTLYVVEVISGAAADEAGIKAGDKIIEVDGRKIAGNGTTNEEIFSMLRGELDTPVSVTVKRLNSAQLLHFDMLRSEVPVSPVDAAYMLTDSIAYIRLGKFSENTYPEFLQAYMALKASGARSLVLDLRGNTGGYMAPAVLLANEFLGNSNSLIVSTRGRNVADNRIIASDHTGSFGEDPLVVLIDEFTASSSEIFSGAMQDNDRGLIIGRRSFGKGLVQTPFELADSSEFRLTVQRYYTPSGRSIQKTYEAGHSGEYASEVYNRYGNGEIFSIDSIPIDSTKIFHTAGGRPVYGGGGIMPDIFVPSDTSGVTNYYIRVANAGLLRDFAYEYADIHRATLEETNNTADLLALLPSDSWLLQAFVQYAQTKANIAPRWFYINTSAPLIVNQIKALIARDMLGMDSYFEIINDRDPVVLRAIESLNNGEAAAPVTVGARN